MNHLPPSRRPKRAFPSAVITLLALAAAAGCSLQGHSSDRDDRAQEAWFERPQLHGDEATSIAAIEPPPYNPDVLGELPLTVDATTGLGSTPGAFAVNSDGAATYSVPLNLPAGRMALQPALSLSYNSGAGNSLVGVGFSLAGLSAISRCGQNLRDDNNLQGVRMDD